MTPIQHYLFRSTRRHRREAGNSIPSQDPYPPVLFLDDLDAYDEAVYEEAVPIDLTSVNEELERSLDTLRRAQRELIDSTLASSLEPDLLIPFRLKEKPPTKLLRPPLKAEYLLYFFLRKEERGAAIGDLLEEHAMIQQRFSKRYADVWFCKQVAASLWPLLRRAVIKIAGLVWLGRILRRLIS